jgi:murein DD-endopeptidase MepM/ murein hydrolase activator NlpD
MFGDPFANAFDPLVPADLQQPPLLWMWDTREIWYFTGGPHGGWDAGSAWAAVDFAPPNEQQGCAVAQAWVTAAAAGVVVRAEDGAVTQDLDGDGFEQTGWTLLYMHMDNSERVAAGQVLPAGGRIGHPSCEGGYSNASHLHFARRYNGVWIAADNPVAPLNVAGWTARSAPREYDGWLVKGDRQLEAWDGYTDINALTMLQN